MSCDFDRSGGTRSDPSIALPVPQKGLRRGGGKRRPNHGVASTLDRYMEKVGSELI
jgi:hypothetical protein